MSKINRVTLIVLDSAGVGELPDARQYGDEGSNTLGNLASAAGGLNLPNMEKMGLGNIIDILGVSPVVNPENSAFGKAAEASSGKDTTIGHWEIAGIIKTDPFPTFPNGFSDETIREFEEKTGHKVIGNCVASGTQIIDELGDEHVKTGALIVYTSADSVFQIAAHEGVVPIEEQYRFCEIAREMLSVGRVIARPFIGESGAYARTTNRHDYSMEPEGVTILDKLQENGKEVLGVGKIYDIFAGRGVTNYVRSKNNMEGVDRTIEYLKEKSSGLIFTNLVDFDMHFGHRRDVQGYKNALEEFDARLPDIMENMNDDDVLMLTADHGCDPTQPGTDHTREYIPIVVYGKKIKSADLGERKAFADIASTIEEMLLGGKPSGSFAS
ncbi:MAG: phosphopentomutase, partial [Bacteriovoracaceae bacterium]|nr:phosphopentomutase [Bacteriovoracaceae bacterium]